MSRLEWRGLALTRGGRPALDGVTLTLAPGELLGIVGPNGAGKSALLRCAVGLDRPGAGAVRLDGRTLADWPAAERARRIAYLPQSAEAPWPIPVAAAVALGRLPHGDADRPAGRAAVAAALAAVGIESLAKRALTALSGGERALALLARALAVEADLLLLDEPLAALDPHHQLAVLDLLAAQAAAGRAVGLVLHDLTLAARFCSRVALLAGGRLRADGPPAVALSDALLAEAYAIRAHRAEIEGEALLVPWRREDAGSARTRQGR
ncbi:ABC transporter ATP-binding protein [Phaeospirillum tilakii]|uniref:ABC transporter ATP-binding protein n=1 Tax=Phaeospirillum tilakii TaxID=741673 RepID=A0ABW5C6V0_9PROT